MKRFYGSFDGRPSGLARVKKLYHDEWPVGIIDDIYRYGLEYKYATEPTRPIRELPVAFDDE